MQADRLESVVCMLCPVSCEPEQHMYTGSVWLHAFCFRGLCLGVMATSDAAGSMPDELEQDSYVAQSP